MNYRVEFLAEDRDTGALASGLGETRFPTYLHAVTAARSVVMQLDQPCPDRVVVNIFDLRDRLASRLQLAVPATAAVAR